MTSLKTLSTVVISVTLSMSAWSQAPQHPAEALDDSLFRLLNSLASVEANIQSSRRSPADKRRALDGIQSCIAMSAGVRRQLAEYRELERVSIAPASDSQQSRQLLELLRKKRNLLAPVVAGAAHELIDTAFNSSDAEVKKGCKEALDAVIVALATVAELDPIPGKR
jgi:hypothetical protein